MSEMVERVAKALQDVSFYDRGRAAYLMDLDEAARAAIEAMREPTEAMLSDAKSALNLHFLRPDYAQDSHQAAVDAWQSMIDAALA